MASKNKKSLGVFTSGGDAPGMNAAVRAVVRTALDRGVDIYAIYEGYQGLVDGGDYIRKMSWESVGGILHRGGTVIGSARCAAFRTREGRLQAAHNLISHNIDGLVIIGGDGSLTGANLFRQEWPDLVAELVKKNKISRRTAQNYPQLAIVGLVGSIDNDMFGTDMTIGADTALHRITSAVDALTSTAASHQRVFVVEVMGRHCGYLALMSGLATGANWVLVPEHPPDSDDWEMVMCRALKAGREIGRRQSIVIVAEGAQDRQGNPIKADYVKQVLDERLGEDTRVTILGHVQRGGTPSAFDRNLSTLLGHAAVEQILSARPEDEPQLIGIRENDIVHSPLMTCVTQTHQVAEAIKDNDYEQAMSLRGSSFKVALDVFYTLVRVFPRPPEPDQKQLRLAVLHAGGPAPGMNTAVRAVVRFAIDKGHTVLGVQNGFRGFINGHIKELGWMDVSGWVAMGGAELGASRKIPEGGELYTIARQIEDHNIEGLLIIGGWAGYQAAYNLYNKRHEFPSFNIPIVCLPASINNNLPGSEYSVGADTALNSIVEAVDKIKQSAVASQRCFIVEVRGRYCGYLALMSGLASGAERVYLHEEGVTLQDLQADLNYLIDGFQKGKRLGLIIRNEYVNELYTTSFMRSLFDQEGRDLFDVRQAILGHLQQGGDPSPFDRIQATRLAVQCIELLVQEAGKESPGGACVGLQAGKIHYTNLEDLPRLMDEKFQRPKEQWWLKLRPVAKLLAQSGPKIES